MATDEFHSLLPISFAFPGPGLTLDFYPAQCFPTSTACSPSLLIITRLILRSPRTPRWRWSQAHLVDDIRQILQTGPLRSS